MAKDVSTELDLPSAWLLRFSPLLTRGLTVLELAAGNGRNTKFLASLGLGNITAVDINEPETRYEGVDYLLRDLEGEPWPFEDESFDAVVAINYLWRERFDLICRAVKPAGVLIYETFTEEQPLTGSGPKNPAHFLLAGELLRLIPQDWRVIAFEDGMTDRGQFYQRIVARRPIVNGKFIPVTLRVCARR